MMIQGCFDCVSICLQWTCIHINRASSDCISRVGRCARHALCPNCCCAEGVDHINIQPVQINSLAPRTIRPIEIISPPVPIRPPHTLPQEYLEISRLFDESDRATSSGGDVKKGA